MESQPAGYNRTLAIVVLICGTLLVFLSFGLRQNLGLYMGPISIDLGWGREVFALAIAIQSLVWGISTPLMGYLADRYGPAKIAATGGIFYVIGLLMMSWASTPLDAQLGIGFFTGVAVSMTGFPIVLSVIGRLFPPEKRSLVLGIASAGGSSGQLVLVPVGQLFINADGWSLSMIYLALLAGLIVPLSMSLAGGNRRAADDHSTLNFGEAMREAGGHRGYKLLVVGYFVCGFQTMFIGAHFPAYLTDLGHSPWLGATALALIGAFNIVGCIIWGRLGGIYSKKNLLCILYATRALLMAIFVSLPITPASVIIFASTMGLLWLGTIPLTTGIVAQIFGTQFMATLVGFTFVSHQIGSFLGIWLGGVVFDLYGNYDPIFWGGIFLGFAAALVHAPIDERPLARLAAAAP